MMLTGQRRPFGPPENLYSFDILGGENYIRVTGRCRNTVDHDQRMISLATAHSDLGS